MEILDVVRTPIGPVNVNTSFRIQFSLLGAAGVRTPGFEFPFWNDSLTQNLLEFLSKGSIGFLVLPKQDGELTYTGESLSPVWIGYNEEFFEMTGETEATDPGTYRVTFTPKEHYEWLDGGQEPRETTWKIKALIEPYCYGFDITLGTSDPVSRVTYPSDVDNSKFVNASMKSGIINYGDWPSNPGEGFLPKPCMVTYDGIVAEYLDPEDYTKTIDGASSRVGDVSFNGNAMVEWPIIYTKRWESGGIYHFRCSNVQLDPDYECWSNYDKKSNRIEHFYTPIFFGSIDSSGRLRSISGQSGNVSKTAQYDFEAAGLNGEDWTVEVAVDRFLLQDLLILMFKSTNIQTALGVGYSASSNTAPMLSGALNKSGYFAGSTDGTKGVKAFGMEHPYGNYNRRVAGFIYVNGNYKLKITRGNRDGTTATDYNLTGSGYINGPTPTTGNGYIKTTVTESYGRLPVAAGGTSSTYDPDQLSLGGSTTVPYIAAFGGRWLASTICGPYCTYLSFSATSSYDYLGSSISCKPSLKT